MQILVIAAKGGIRGVIIAKLNMFSVAVFIFKGGV
jgi:hypothetical protein